MVQVHCQYGYNIWWQSVKLTFSCLLQHDVSQVLLKGTLDSVVEECVSFVGVDINICSETLLR